LITVKYTLSSATLLSQPQLKPLWSSLAWLFATTSYLVSALRTTSHPPHKHQNCLSEIYICGLKVVQTPVLPKKKKTKRNIICHLQLTAMILTLFWGHRYL
jgi:hypothetical protein